MRGLLVCIVAALVACGTGSSAGTGGTSLTVAYWPSGIGKGGRETWTLRCHPPRGTLPGPARACRRLTADSPRLFAPVPPKTLCTEIYGGPQMARVSGTVRGHRVLASFSRTNGCEIARWNRLSPWLLPPGGVT